MKQINEEKILTKSASQNALSAQQQLQKGGYIKGYGSQARVMDSEHRPMFNMPVSDLHWLMIHKIVRKENNVWVLNETAFLMS